jgi:hypothetical protein
MKTIQTKPEMKIDEHKLVEGDRVLYLPKDSLWKRFLIWLRIKKNEQGIYKVTEGNYADNKN